MTLDLQNRGLTQIAVQAAVSNNSPPQKKTIKESKYQDIQPHQPNKYLGHERIHSYIRCKKRLVYKIKFCMQNKTQLLTLKGYFYINI